MQTFKEQNFGNVALVYVPELAGLDVNYPRLPRGELALAPTLVAMGTGFDQHDMLGSNFASFHLNEGLGIAVDGIEMESDHFTAHDENGQALCDGDAGGPLVIPGKLWSDQVDDPEITRSRDEIEEIGDQDVLVGIGSWSAGAGCSPNDMHAYLDVSTWSDWIESIINLPVAPLPVALGGDASGHRTAPGGYPDDDYLSLDELLDLIYGDEELDEGYSPVELVIVD